MKKILVVEDEPDIRELLASYLRNEGYDVAAAEDGVAALSCFSEDKFDLVILDIMIQKIDGYGVCEVIKKQSVCARGREGSDQGLRFSGG